MMAPQLGMLMAGSLVLMKGSNEVPLMAELKEFGWEDRKVAVLAFLMVSHLAFLMVAELVVQLVASLVGAMAGLMAG